MIIKEVERSYKDELIQFADRVGPTDEDIFAQSFHRFSFHGHIDVSGNWFNDLVFFRLVHSSSLEEILLKERSYARVISDMIQHMDKEVEKLNSSQQEEMETKINQLDITTTSEVAYYSLKQICS